MTELSGTCMCGASTFTATPTPGGLGAGACHCGMCRKWSGGMYLSVDCGSSVTFAEGAPVGSYKGSAWGERLFCKECGSSLLWQTQDGQNQHVSINTCIPISNWPGSSKAWIDTCWFWPSCV
ncbi:MAG: GFA family protein, partial [Pseudomonadota bacterium]